MYFSCHTYQWCSEWEAFQWRLEAQKFWALPDTLFWEERLDYNITHSSISSSIQLCVWDSDVLLYCACVAQINELFIQNPFPTLLLTTWKSSSFFRHLNQGAYCGWSKSTGCSHSHSKELVCSRTFHDSGQWYVRSLLDAPRINSRKEKYKKKVPYPYTG